MPLLGCSCGRVEAEIVAVQTAAVSPRSWHIASQRGPPCSCWNTEHLHSSAEIRPRVSLLQRPTRRARGSHEWSPRCASERVGRVDDADRDTREQLRESSGMQGECAEDVEQSWEWVAAFGQVGEAR